MGSHSRSKSAGRPKRTAASTGKHKPTAVDLFCGAGGLTEGLRQAGFKVVGAVDIDPLACRTYRQNHPDVKVWERDLSSVNGTVLMGDLDLRRGELDLLAACPPCQGFSTLRTINGSRSNRDPRNQLIYHVLRVIRSTRPKSVMLENVPKLRRSRQFTHFRRSLVSMGYKVRWAVLNALDYGVPQRRRRLVLIAS